ncbi:MAG: hypothetical protein ACJA2Q_002969 [Pseudohongiellaceae bacterium]
MIRQDLVHSQSGELLIKSKPDCIPSLLLVEAVEFPRLRLLSNEVMRFLGWLILIDLEE